MFKFIQALRLCFTLSTLYCFSASVLATGFNFWESSAVNSSLASANGAKAMDASVLAMAPSSMTQLKQRQINANLTYYAVSTDYQVFNQTAYYKAADPIPAGFMVLPINDDWHFGLAIHSRTAADISVPSIPLVNPDEVRLKPILISMTPSIAYQWGSLSVAGSLEYIYADYLLEQTKCVIFIGCNFVETKGEQDGWSGAFSATWQANEAISLALTHQLPASFSDPAMAVYLPRITRAYLSVELAKGLDWHQSYSYSQWQGKGIKFSDYPDHLGLLKGQQDSHRYATGINYDIEKWRFAAGFSVDQAIDSFGGNDYRYRLGLGYQLSSNLRADLSYVKEQYASKLAKTDDLTIVSVQNKGNAFSLGFNYYF